MVGLILPAEGEAGVLSRLRNGTLGDAVTRLPPAGMEIARELRSFDQGLQLVGYRRQALPQVIELGLHKRIPAAEITGQQLRRVLALDDRTATTRIASIPRAARDILLELPDRDLRSPAALSEAELQTLASYLTGLEPQARERVMKTVAAPPLSMQALAPAASAMQSLQARTSSPPSVMMLRADAGFDSAPSRNDLALIYAGRSVPYWSSTSILQRLPAQELA